ncbi:VOC family protein [bacterium]|nr:VOC family protein [bacterium]
MANPITWWEIGVANAGKAKEFYGKLFDWKIEEMSAMKEYHTVDTGGEGINGGIFQTPSDVPSYVAIYVEVDNLQAYLDKAQSLGGKPIVPPTKLPGDSGSFAMFLDPDNNAIGLFSK